MFSFHHWFLLSFLGVFIVDCVCSLHHCFFMFFFFHHWFYYCFLSVFISPSFFTVTVFCQVLRFCVVVQRMLRIWESFFLLSGVLYLTLRPEIWHNLLLSRLPWGRQFSLQGCRAFHWCSKHRPGPTVCLSHTVQQTVFVARFYLCIKVLRNTI